MERYGDIAVDDVSLQDEICPAAPQAAAKWTAGCTFEVRHFLPAALTGEGGERL